MAFLLLKILTGRANDLAKFVKRGKTEEEAFVEVDILEQSGSLSTLRRTINAASNSSKWMLNRRPCSLSEAKNHIARFQIDVDNLCSFMPQDKVGKFTQYSPKEVLQNTLKSIRYGSRHARAPVVVPVTGNSSSNSSSAITHDLAENEEAMDVEDRDVSEGKDLFTEQQELSDTQTNKEDLRKRKESKQTQVENLKKQMDILSLELNRIKQKDRAKELKKNYEIKLLKLNGTELKSKREEKKQEIQELINHIKTLSEELSPEKIQLRDYEKLLSRLQRDENTMIDQLQSTSEKITNKIGRVTDNEENAEKMSIEVINVETIRLATQKEYENKTNEYNKTELKYKQSLKDSHLIQEEIDKLQDERNDILMKQDSTNNKIEELKDRIEQNINIIRDITKQLSSLQDSRAIFKQKLQQRSEVSGDRLFRDTVIAMNWLEQNEELLTQQNRRIIGPIALQIKTRDNACAAMLEQIIPLNRLLGFLVTNDSDATFLKKKLRGDMKLQVDIFTMKNVSRETPKLPYSEEMVRRIQDHHIPGLQGYLYRQIECDDIVRSFLFSFQALHTILWGRTEGSSNITTDQLMTLCPPGVPGFRLFMHEKSNAVNTPSRSSSTPQRRDGGAGSSIIEFNGRKSRYAPNAPPSTASFVVTPKGLITAGSGGDDTSIEDLRREYQEKKHRYDLESERLSAELMKEETLFSQFQTEALGMKNQIQDLMKKLKLPQQLEAVMVNLKKSIKDLEKRLTVDSNKQKKEKQQQYASSVDQLLNHLEGMTTDIEAFTQQRMDRRVFQTMKQLVQSQFEEKQSQLKKKEKEIEALRKQKEILQRELDKVERELEEATMTLKDIMDRESPGNRDYFINVIFPKIMDECPETTREEIEDRIVEIEAQIKAIIDNPEVVERYQDLERDYEKASKELEIAEKEYLSAETTLQQRSEHWLNTVQTITQKLNNLFSAYMKGLGFDGEVVLRPIGRFIDYEMQLRVTFREGAPCTDLSGARHSGGERAVSTIMFLMALQQMTSSPFRVVDEINQGMDERNERLVFDRVVKSCCEDSLSPQYFLVTPKLLQGLRCLDHPQVTVLLIWNGPGIQEKWNLSTIVRNLKRKKGVMEEEDEAAELENRSKYIEE